MVALGEHFIQNAFHEIHSQQYDQGMFNNDAHWAPMIGKNCSNLGNAVTTLWIRYYIPISQIKKLRQEGLCDAQNHKATKQQSQDSNPKFENIPTILYAT